MEEVAPGRCESCGRPANVLSTGMCVPCELEIRAREPPEFLKDMRHVYAGWPADTQAKVMLKGIMDNNPKEFLLQLRGAEREYKAHMKALAEIEASRAPKASTEPRDSVEVDEAEGKVEELIERLLKEAAN